MDPSEIPFQSISSVIAYYYIIRETIVQNTGTKITENVPILYILYTLHGERKLLNIPFPHHHDAGLNLGLRHLHVLLHLQMYHPEIKKPKMPTAFVFAKSLFCW